MNSVQTDPGLHLNRTIEELFHNFTISLMSAPYFLKDATCASYTEEGDCMGSKEYDTKATVNVTTWPQVYNYSASTLLVTYGIAVSVSAVAVLIGLGTIFAIESSYSNDFSMILRATRHAQMSAPVDTQDDGRDPLPSPLADAYLKIRPSHDDMSAEIPSVEHGSVPLTEAPHKDLGSCELQDLDKVVSKKIKTRAGTL